jgi:hypothetical protein
MIAPKPHPKVFTRPKRLAPRRQAVTIGIGFKCIDGVVLAADQQVTWGESHKSYERKFRSHSSGDEWNASFTFSGSPVLFKSFNDKFGESMALLLAVRGVSS